MKILSITSSFFLLATIASAQQPDSLWTLQRCVERAVQENNKVKQSELSLQQNQLNVEQARASRYPSVSASASHTFDYSRDFNNVDGSYDNYSGHQRTNVGVSSSVTLYDGFRLRNEAKQSVLAVQQGKLAVESSKDEVSLMVLDAFLQILYAREQVKNCQKQEELSAAQLQLANERMNVGMLSKADYLQVKSQLASERAALANAQKNLAASKLNLRQLIELPASESFDIDQPQLESLMTTRPVPAADSVYAVAAEQKSLVKSADLEVESAKMSLSIARTGYSPRLMLNGDIGTGYSSTLEGQAFDYQMRNKLTPSVGLSLVIPIYQNGHTRTSVSRANIAVRGAELSATNTRNLLRKDIEQACLDITSSQEAYVARKEEYEATRESFDVATEKYEVGMLSSLDYMVQKTRLISAESNLLQSKYNLIFSYKTLDYYMGIPLNL